MANKHDETAIELYLQEMEDPIFNAAEDNDREPVLEVRMRLRASFLPTSFQLYRLLTRKYGQRISKLSSQTGIDPERLKAVRDGALLNEVEYRSLLALVRDKHTYRLEDLGPEGPIADERE